MDAYGDSEREHGVVVSELERTTRQVEAARMASFLVGSVVGLLYDDLPIPPWAAVAFATVALAVFLVLVVRHRTLRRVLRRARTGRALARLGLRRLQRDWAGIADVLGEVGYDDPLLEPPLGSAEHPYLDDLDLFGPESVRALLGPTPTPTGVRLLREWLESPAPIAEVRRRQVVVRALAADPAGRERMAAEALLVDRVDRESWVVFGAWLQSPALALPGWARHAARMLPPVTIGLFVVWAAGGGLPAWAWLLPLAIQTVLARRWGRTLGPYLDAATSRSRALRRHHELFVAWEQYQSAEAEVGKIQARFRSDAALTASHEIRTLERWLDAADSRASMLHFVFDAVFLWDVHVATGLEGWRHRAGAHVVPWFEAIGELEALSALATLAYDHPDWCFPELADGVPTLRSAGLGHPLLADDVRKTSDVSLEPPGRFLLVTGSNMSGKSTLLRSIGLAAVLGQAGSVVCARSAVITPLRTFSSMRIQDSLTAGVSLFMAELLRLKALVDAADSRSADGTALLYLIDEVLQGTNSEERRIAARRIVRHLLGAHAIGAVTTHDLSLHDDPTLDPASRKVHFRETVAERGGAMLTFDYKLRPGLATSRNALKLLKWVGLDDE